MLLHPLIRHPEVRAQRASKGDGIQVGYSRLGNSTSFGASAVSFEGRLRRPPQDDGTPYSAARKSDFTSSSISLTLEPSSLAMSSWYFSSTPSVSDTVAGSSATTSSSDNAAAQSKVSATPGDLNRSCLRNACTKATTCSDSFLLTPGTLVRTMASSRSAVG